MNKHLFDIVCVKKYFGVFDNLPPPMPISLRVKLRLEYDVHIPKYCMDFIPLPPMFKLRAVSAKSKQLQPGGDWHD